jgi:hypothetical protein
MTALMCRVAQRAGGCRWTASRQNTGAMATLPMLHDPAHKECRSVLESRRVFAPGGYEWWRIEARSTGGTAVLVEFSLGGIGRKWWRDYRGYLRRPTRRLPPLPAQSPVVQWRIYDAGGMRMQGRHSADPAQTEILRDRLAVRIGPGVIDQADDGTMRLSLTPPDGGVIQLEFHPRWQGRGHVRRLLHGGDGAEHHWQASDAVVHDVEGRIEGARASSGDSVPFRGLGMCSYHYGTRPIAADVRWWLRARLLEPDRLITKDVLFAAGNDERSHGGQGMQIESTADSLREAPQTADRLASSALGVLRPQLPLEIGMGSSIRLVRPRVVESSPGLSLLTYEVAETDGAAVADCVILRPRWYRE